MRKINTSTSNPIFTSALVALDNHLQLNSRAISTRTTYTRALKTFMYTMDKLPEECTQREILQYFIDFKTKNTIQNATLKQYIFSIKYYLYNISNTPEIFSKIPIPRVKRYNIDVLNVDEIFTLLSLCKNIRERIILELLYETGMRIGELSRLKLEDIDFFHNSISIINSKNMVTRTVFFGENLKSTLKEYLRSSKSLFSDTLLSKKYHPFISLSKTGIYWALKSVVKRSFIKKRVTAHSLRHSFSVHYLNFGGSIFQLQKLLGHKHIETTCHY